jgi:hypothetical protein
MNGAMQSRLTVDFRGNLQRSRAWILGERADRPGRIELLRMAEPRETVARSAATHPSAAEADDCRCPEFCERDHANE